MTNASSPWPCCDRGIECRGIQVPGYTACLAHLNEADRNTYIASLTPGADIDHRGTVLSEVVLDVLVDALRVPSTGKPEFGAARFAEAHFEGANFDDATFLADVEFNGATFMGDAQFEQVTFCGNARFGDTSFRGGADFTRSVFASNAIFAGSHFQKAAGFVASVFNRDARFRAVIFDGSAGFGEAIFSDSADFSLASFASHVGFYGASFAYIAEFGDARFAGAAMFNASKFSDEAWFHGAAFDAHARFDGVNFTKRADFSDVRFEVATTFGPVVCGDRLDLSGAIFPMPMTLEIAARAVDCLRTRWESTATLRLRYAFVDLAQAVLTFPVAVASHPEMFTFRNGHGELETACEILLEGISPEVKVTSIQGVDAAHLVLVDTDLKECLFFGAFHLDQLRLEGRTKFSQPPVGIHRRPLWWATRRTLVEEHHWRAVSVGQPTLPTGQAPSSRQWRVGPHHPDEERAPDPEDVAALYRHLRKAFEDGKNEPGAADFYYGEMEMRRLDRTSTSAGERSLLWAYWVLSGYGLRASRALGWLALALLVTIILMMGWGLPDSSPKQTASGTVPASGGRVSLVLDKPDPDLTLPFSRRFTVERFDKAAQVVLNSVVFRSSGQDLTTVGTYTEMVSRFAEPTLLALAVLAMRARIKR